MLYVRSLSQHLVRGLLLVAFAASVSAGAVNAEPLSVQTSVSGFVRAEGKPVPGAVVTAAGPQKRSGVTNAQGAFTLTLAPGLYSIGVTKAGFQSATRADVALAAGETVRLAFELTPASFSSLKQIASVTTTAGAANVINTSSAAIVDVPQSTFTEQGQLGVNHVLNEIPGIVVSPGDGFGIDEIANAASPLATGIPQIRGALPYETESLIDGHPISIGEYGTFNTSFLSPYLLQSVEVVKGPGASPPNISNAIGGTVNFVTLQPTVKREGSIDYGVDQFGGLFWNGRATGTISHLSYAFDYVTRGTNGYNQSFEPLMPVYAPGGYSVNGTPACASAANAASLLPGLRAGQSALCRLRRANHAAHALLPLDSHVVEPAQRVGEASLHLYADDGADRQLSRGAEPRRGCRRPPLFVS